MFKMEQVIDFIISYLGQGTTTEIVMFFTSFISIVIGVCHAVTYALQPTFHEYFRLKCSPHMG